MLFRVAHWWCTNIDIDEYVDLLEKIYVRIIDKAIMSFYGEVENEIKAYVYVTFPNEEKKYKDNGGKVDKAIFSDDWLECRSDESNRSECDYKYEEDAEKMVVKKFKRNKVDASAISGGMGQTNSNLTIKEPIIYEE